MTNLRGIPRPEGNRPGAPVSAETPPILISAGRERMDRALEILNELGDSGFAADDRELIDVWLKRLSKEFGPASGVVTAAYFHAIQAFHKKGDFDNAKRLSEEFVALTHKLFGLEHTLTISAMTMLAKMHRQLGNFDEARKLHKEILETMNRVNGPDQIPTLKAHLGYAVFLETSGELESSRNRLEYTVSKMETLVEADDPLLLRTKEVLKRVVEQIEERDRAQQRER